MRNVITAVGLAAEAGIDRLQALEAAQEEAGADQQQRRDRDLRHHQRVAQPRAAALAAAGRVVLERRRQIVATAVERGCETEREAGERARSPW